VSDAPQTFRLVHSTARRLAKEAIDRAPEGMVCVVRAPNRSLDQNDKFHALVADIVKSGATWRGERLDTDDWKALLVSAHDKAVGLPGRVLPGIEGEFVAIRRSTAKMSKAQMSSLIEYVTAWAVSNGIPLRETAP
jgi:hypothetical protein